MLTQLDDDSNIDEEEGSMILEEEIDPNYEPTQDEIEEYAKYLGMDLQTDQQYFYLAKEGLKAPLPDHWKPYRNSSGEIYYINLNTQEVVFDHPCDQHYKKLFHNTKFKQKVMDKQNEKKQFSSSPSQKQSQKSSPVHPMKQLPLMNPISSISSKKSILERIEDEALSAQHQMINESFSQPSEQKNINQPKAQTTTVHSVQDTDNEALERNLKKKLDNYKEQMKSSLEQKRQTFKKEQDQFIKVQDEYFLKICNDLQEKKFKLSMSLQNQVQEKRDQIQARVQMQQEEYFQSLVKQKQDIFNCQKLKLQMDHDAKINDTEDELSIEYETKIKSKKQSVEEWQKKNETAKEQLNDKIIEKRDLCKKKFERQKQLIICDYEEKITNVDKQLKNKQNKELYDYKDDLRNEIQEIQLMNKKEQQKKESDIICQKQNFREMIQIKINIYRREQEQILQKTLKEFEQKQIQDINQSLSQEHQQKIEQQTNIYKKEYENKLHDDAQIIQRSIVECYSGQQTQRDKRMTDYMQKSFSDMNQWMFKPKHLENLSKEIDQLKVQVKELHFQNNQYRKILRESLQQVPQHLKDRQKKKIFEESIEKNVEDDLSLIQLHKEIKEIDLKEPPFEDEIEYQRCNSGDQILEWGDVIINEIEIMTQVKRKLRQDKEKLKLSSQQLKEYQTKFQKEKKKPQYKEEQIQSVKQNFNEQVDKINLIMEKLRKREILIKSKEQALLNLQLQYKKNSNPSLLQVFYKTYMSFKIKKSDNQKSEAQEEEEQSKNEQYPEKIQDEDDEEIYLLKQKNKQLDISGGSGDSHLFFDPTLYDKVFYNSDNNNESNDDDLPLEDQNDEQQTHDVADTHDNVPSVPKVFIEQKEIKQGFNYDPLDAFPKFNSIINFPQHQKEIFNRQKNQILQHQFKYNKLDGSLRRDQMSSAFQSQNQWFNKIKGQLNKHIYNNKSSNNSSNYGL